MNRAHMRFSMTLASFAILLLTYSLVFTTSVVHAESEKYLVADFETNSLSVITPAGVSTQIYHFSGTKAWGVQDAKPDSSGNYVVTEAKNDLLSKVTPSGVRTVIYTFPANTYPFGVRVDSSGNYLVTELYTQILSKITPAGVRTVIYNFTGEGIVPSDVAVDSSGNYIVTESNPPQISKITPAGVRTVICNFTAGYPNMIEIDSSGNYIITEGNVGILSKITPAGVRTVLYNFPVYAGPINAVIDPSGNYLVTTGGSNIFGIPPELSRLTPAGVRTVIYNFNYSAFPVSVIYVALPPSVVTLGSPTEVTETSMKLSWTACGDSDFKNYTVYRSTDQGSLGTPITTITSNSTMSYTATGLSADSTYYFKIRTCDAGSLYSDSNQLNAKTSAAPLPILPIALVLVVVLAASTFLIFRMRARSYSK